MPRIPMESLTTVRSPGVPLEPGAFNQSAQATANLMKSVEGAVHVVKAQFDKAQDLRNDMDISKKQRLIRETQSDFQNRMLKDPDTGYSTPPEQWGEKWEEELLALEKRLRLSEVPPVVQRAVQKDFNNFKSTSSIQISGEALKLNLRQARQNIDADLRYYEATEQWGKAHETLERARGKALTDSQVDNGQRTIGYKQERSEVDYSRQANAREHRKLLDDPDQFPSLGPADRQREKVRTDALITQEEAEALDMITMDIQDYPTAEDVRKKLDETPAISKKAADRYMKNYGKIKPLTLGEQKVLIDQLDALIEMRGQPEEIYLASYNGMMNLLSTFGDRPGTGKYRQELNNYHSPAQYTDAKNLARSAKERAEMTKPIDKLARSIISVRSKEYADLQYAKQQKLSTAKKALGKAEKVHNVKIRAALDAEALKIDYALNEAVAAIIWGAPEGTPTKEIEADVREFLDSPAADDIIQSVFNPVFNHGGKVSPKSAREKANERLEKISPPETKKLSSKSSPKKDNLGLTLDKQYNPYGVPGVEGSTVNGSGILPPQPE